MATIGIRNPDSGRSTGRDGDIKSQRTALLPPGTPDRALHRLKLSFGKIKLIEYVRLDREMLIGRPVELRTDACDIFMEP